MNSPNGHPLICLFECTGLNIGRLLINQLLKQASITCRVICNINMELLVENYMLETQHAL